MEKIWLPSPWNEIEVGMASMMNIPVLLIKDKDIQTGIFDQNLSETDIKTYVLPRKRNPSIGKDVWNWMNSYLL